jgi:nucleoside-triphosphatase THEP1
MVQKTIFFAYEDGHQDNKDAISRAARDYNNHQKNYKIKKWEDLRVSGKIIGTEIFEQIRNCSKFACDLTYLNHNVLFELGYAISQKKILKLFLNPNIEGAVQNYSDLKILKTIGYVKFLNSKEIVKELQSSSSKENTLLLDKIIPNYEKIEYEYDVFLINIKNKNQAAIDIEDYLYIIEKKFITNNENEIPYQTLNWYLNSILKSNIILLHMVGPDKTDYKVTNAEYSLYAGLAYGLGKEVLIIAPSPFRAPIDYSDILVDYASSTDCVNKVEVWLNQRFSKIAMSHPVQTIDIDTDEIKEINLLKLGIGDGVAERDDCSSSDTFVETDAYIKATQKHKALIVGRKGSGKTEIFLRLKEEFIADKNYYYIIIKPDSDEMLSDVELTTLYSNERSKKAFLMTVWQYVIYSKIFQQIFDNKEKIGLKDKEIADIDNYQKENKDIFDNNFYGMILYISKQFDNQNITQDPSLLEKIKHKLFPMMNIIFNIFEKRKYQKIIILADNLDSGWESKSDLDIQSLMLICLFEFIDGLNVQFKNRIDIRSVIFLRKDIYNYILGKVREPDKFSMDIIEINWERFPSQLKNVIDKRMLYVLGSNENIEKIWENYFTLKSNINPFEKVLSLIVKRPRDAIYFISKLFESAAYNNRLSVNDDDFDYALDVYTKFLYSNLIAELKAEFPLIDDVLQALQRIYTGLLNHFTYIPVENFYKIVQPILGKDKTDKIIKVLMENNYLVATIKKEKSVIDKHEEFTRAMEEKTFKFFKKHKIQLNMKLIPFAE